MEIFLRTDSCQDLIILGGGAASVCMLIAFTRQVRKQFTGGLPRPINITILEKTKHAGNGFPYDPDLNHEVLRNNNPNSGMIIDEENKNDFADWLRDEKDNLINHFPHLAQIIEDNANGQDLYSPRFLFGLYLRQRLREYTDTANTLGIHVRTITDVNVVDVIQDANKNWYFQTEQQETFFAKNILIAAGHLPSEKYSNLHNIPGYVNTPYTDLASIPDAPVFILGSGLSAIDAAKILNAQHFHAPIYMISPSGQLPRVKGPLAATKYQMRFLTPANLDKKNLRLDEALDLFAEEIKHAMKRPDWTRKRIFELARKENDDAIRILQNEINCINQHTIRGWQLVLTQIWYEAFLLFQHNLDDRDRAEFIKYYLPIFLKWAAGMIFVNAVEMLDLATRGQLRFIKTRADVTYNDDSRQFELLTANGILTAATVINATGTGFNISNNPTLCAMLTRGLIRQEPLRGGIDMNADSQVIAADGTVHDNAFTLGIITLGRNLDASTIEMTAYKAAEIAAPIMAKMLESKTSFAHAM